MIHLYSEQRIGTEIDSKERQIWEVLQTSKPGPRYAGFSLAVICQPFIQPGNPQQNAYMERYNRTARYHWLGQYLFCSLDELQRYAPNGSGFIITKDG
jgi:hypothetical protein